MQSDYAKFRQIVVPLCVVLHILNCVQAIEDVTIEIVEELVVVRLLVKNYAIVFQPIVSGPVHVMKHARACWKLEEQTNNSPRKSNTAFWHCSAP